MPSLNCIRALSIYSILMRQITHLDKYGLPARLRDLQVELEVCSGGLAQLAVHQRLVQVQHQRLLCIKMQ